MLHIFPHFFNFPFLNFSFLFLDHPIVNTKVQMKISKLFKSSMINFHYILCTTSLQSFDKRINTIQLLSSMIFISTEYTGLVTSLLCNSPPGNYLIVCFASTLFLRIHAGHYDHVPLTTCENRYIYEVEYLSS